MASFGRKKGSQVIQEFCGLRSQQTVAVFGHKISYVFKEMVTKVLVVGPNHDIILRVE